MTVHNPKMFIFFLFNNKLPSSSLVLCGLPVMGRPTQNLRGELLQYNTAFSEEFLQVFQEGITFLHFDNFMYPIGQQTQGILHLPLTRGGPTHTQEAHRLEWRMSQLQKGHLGIFTNPPYSADDCGDAGGGSQARGKDKKKMFSAHLGFFSVPSSAAHQGSHNNITRASKLMPLFGIGTWKMGSFSPNGHCCLISCFLEPLTLAEGSQNLSNRLLSKLWPNPWLQSAHAGILPTAAPTQPHSTSLKCGENNPRVSHFKQLHKVLRDQN